MDSEVFAHLTDRGVELAKKLAHGGKVRHNSASSSTALNLTCDAGLRPFFAMPTQTHKLVQHCVACIGILQAT